MIDATRRTQIIRLLETRDDHLPTPIRREHSPAGFVHRTVVRETCPDCFGENPGKIGCETCRSQGYLETMRERDPYAVTEVQPYGLDVTRHERRRERDREIERLNDQLAPPRPAAELLEQANKRGEPWEEERNRKWADYDYAALDAALEVLYQRDPGAYHLLHGTYVYGWQEPSVAVEHAVERGLAFIDTRMPETIRAPHDEPVDTQAVKASLWRGKSERHAAQREARRLRVLRAVFDWGWSVEQVAAHESLTGRRVRQLLAEASAADTAIATGPAA